MKQGLSGAGEWTLLVKNKTKTRQPARLDKARHGRNRIHSKGNIDEELAPACKHKEIIKGANEEGNEQRQLGQINQ